MEMKFRRRRRRRVPGLNTTATADISFMLLVFFLVTTSIDTDKGLPRLLPAPPEEQVQTLDIEKRNVLNIVLDAADRLTCGGEPVELQELQERVETFIKNADDRPDMPERHEKDIPLLGKCMVTDQHVISIQADCQTSYDAYFAMQDAVVAAYNHLRNELAQQRFHRDFRQCTAEQREAIMTLYPQRISEAELTDAQPSTLHPSPSTKKGGRP